MTRPLIWSACGCISMTIISPPRLPNNSNTHTCTLNVGMEWQQMTFTLNMCNNNGRSLESCTTCFNLQCYNVSLYQDLYEPTVFSFLFLHLNVWISLEWCADSDSIFIFITLGSQSWSNTQYTCDLQCMYVENWIVYETISESNNYLKCSVLS